LHANFGIAQHEHNNGSDSKMKILFSTQQSEFSAEVQSASKKMVTKEKSDVYLKLSSKYQIDSLSVALKINSNSGKIQRINNLMEYSNGLYNTEVMFKEPGSYQFTFSFNLIDSSDILKKTNFSFSKDVKSSENKEKEDHGFMGMSSTMMIMMGAAMLVMMIAALIAGTNH
jgi:hypothetical protein